MKIVLGSKSPRRKEILSLMRYEFDVRVSDEEEKIIGNSPVEIVSSIAKQKANNIQISDEELLICADTIVVVDGEILGKPHDTAEAYKMINLIQGRAHKVYTAVTLKTSKEENSFVEEATVVIKHMTKKEIKDYIKTDEPYDKAGGYAIQGIFSKYILAYSGDYYTIMGLPKERLEEALKSILN